MQEAVAIHKVLRHVGQQLFQVLCRMNALQRCEKQSELVLCCIRGRGVDTPRHPCPIWLNFIQEEIERGDEEESGGKLQS